MAVEMLRVGCRGWCVGVFEKKGTGKGGGKEKKGGERGGGWAVPRVL